MNMELSQPLIRDLVKALELATMVGEELGNAYEKHELFNTRMQELKKRIYEQAFAKKTALIEPCPDEGEEHLVPSEEIGEFTERLMADYHELIFWDQLAENMAHRDYAALHPDHSTNSRKQFEKFFMEMDQLEEKYNREFTEHGIERLEITARE